MGFKQKKDKSEQPKIVIENYGRKRKGQRRILQEKK
jgi:hypothetical protein